MRRSFAIPVCVSVAVLAALAPTGVRAQSADVALCDRVAADPSDPDKPADIRGVTEVALSDVPTAVKYCKIASGSKNATVARRALYQLGRAYAADSHWPEAIGLWRKAADKGSTTAMVELGVLFGNGVAVPKDEAEARRLFERAAELGNPRGTINLVALGGGASAGSDPVKTRAMLTRAAQGNSAEAQFQLGLMMAQGAGGPKDDSGARGMFERAAAQNHAGALEQMGEFAETGRGGAKDSDAAKTYYERSAALGNEDARAALKRLSCPFTIKDKRGGFVTDLCF